MLSRTSAVDHLFVEIATFSSIIQIGDTACSNSLSRVFALQRESDTFLGTEGEFRDYAVFSEPIPFQPIQENIVTYKKNSNPIIKVGKIDVIAVSAASTIHIGNLKTVCQESRVKHIRQLAEKKK